MTRPRDTSTERLLTPSQRTLLQAVADLQPNAYGATIHERTGLSIAKIYEELDALHDEYLIGCKLVRGDEKRGMRDKLIWSITPAGRRAIAEGGPGNG